MKKISKKTLLTTLFTFCLLLIALNVKAQIPFDDDVNDENAAPISGLLWLLGVAGASLGIYKIKSKN